MRKDFLLNFKFSLEFSFKFAMLLIITDNYFWNVE